MSPSSPITSLSAHLLSLSPDAFQSATQTPFLEKAGGGTLPKSILEKWLAQDRLYAQAYIRFASLLLANVPMPAKVDPEGLNEQLVDVLIDSITNVRRELKFFEDVASRYGLKLEAKEVSEGVRRYRELFFSVGEEIERHKREMLDGLIVLWGTEKCYLESWRYAAAQTSEEGKQGDADEGALRKEFIPNWTSKEFEEFVDKLGWFVDEVWKTDITVGRRQILEAEKRGWERYIKNGLWGELLEIEKVFWPVVEE